jgi:hypothetical protein
MHDMILYVSFAVLPSNVLKITATCDLQTTDLYAQIALCSCQQHRGSRMCSN